MKIDLEDVAIVGGIGYLVWRALKSTAAPAATPTRTIARVVEPTPVVIAPTFALPYPDYYYSPWGYGPTVFNFGGGGRRGGGGHHYRGGGRRGRR